MSESEQIASMIWLLVAVYFGARPVLQLVMVEIPELIMLPFKKKREAKQDEPKITVRGGLL